MGVDRRTRGGDETRIGRWIVEARTVRIRQRAHSLVLAVREGEPAVPGATAESAIGLVLDTMAKILQAFEGFESFSAGTRQEESARLMRDLESGITRGHEPSRWRALENFGFEAYRPVRAVRARLSASGTASTRRVPRLGQGFVVSDTGQTTSAFEHTALCVADFTIDEVFSSDFIGVGVSEPFTALSQVPELLRSVDVALASAEAGTIVRVDEMRPVEWAAARMSSRFERQIVEDFLARISADQESWETLTTFIDCGADIAEAARALQVHENTVRYRLSRIETVLGARLGDPRTTADIVIALECRRLGRR